MKIISWNVHNDITSNPEKYSHVFEMKPDILILLECSKNGYDSIKQDWKYKNWYNDDLNGEFSELGVAIFSNTCKVQFTEKFNRKYRYVVPYKIENDQISFILFAVWTKTKSDYDYSINITEAIKDEMYSDYVSGNLVIIGDYNTGATDENSFWYNKIKETGMINVAEKDVEYKKTYYHRSNGKYYINDHCFISEKMKDTYKIELNILDLNKEIESNNKYEGYSDHCPLIVEILNK